MKKIDDLINELIEKGSILDVEKLKCAMDELLEEKDKYKYIQKRLDETLDKYLNDESNNVNSISVTLGSDNEEIKINKGVENVLYDIASITKLFGTKLVYELSKEGLLDIEKSIYEIDNRYVFLKEYKIIDILKMKGKIETDGKLSDCSSKEEIMERLKTVKVKDSKVSSSIYTDVGFTVLTDVLANLIPNENTKTLMQKYVFDKHNLSNTCYKPKGDVVGNGNNMNLPNDKKTAVMGGVSLAAGLFSNMDDLVSVSKDIINYTFFDREFINRLLKYKFYDNRKRRRSLGGFYIHCDSDISFASKEFSSKTLAHQGYTGAIIVSDLENKLYNIVVLDAFKNNADKKTEQFISNFYKLQDELIYYTLQLYLCQKMSN